MIPIVPESVLDVLSGLIDKSLVVYEEQPDGTGRYRLLETVRQYARERLAEDTGAEAVGGRHAAHFLSLAEQAEPNLTGAEQAEWLARLEAEHDNLRAALAWYEQRPEGAEGGLRLAGSIWRFWAVRGYFSEGRQWLDRALEQSRHEGDTAVRAAALNGTGGLAYAQGDYAEARDLYGEGLVIRRRLGDQRGIASSLNNLGNVARSQGDLGGARTLYEEGLDIYRRLGEQQGIATALINLGLVAHDQGDYAEARDLYGEGLVIFQCLGEPKGIADSLAGMAAVAHGQGQSGRAARLGGASASLRASFGCPPEPADGEATAATMASVADALGDATFAAAWAAGQSMTWEEATEYALQSIPKVMSPPGRRGVSRAGRRPV
jgi:tetratricopeptide (TPR) repeat protein